MILERFRPRPFSFIEVACLTLMWIFLTVIAPIWWMRLCRTHYSNEEFASAVMFGLILAVLITWLYYFFSRLVAHEET